MKLNPRSSERFPHAAFAYILKLGDLAIRRPPSGNHLLTWRSKFSKSLLMAMARAMSFSSAWWGSLKGNGNLAGLEEDAVGEVLQFLRQDLERRLDEQSRPLQALLVQSARTAATLRRRWRS